MVFLADLPQLLITSSLDIVWGELMSLGLELIQSLSKKATIARNNWIWGPIFPDMTREFSAHFACSLDRSLLSAMLPLSQEIEYPMRKPICAMSDIRLICYGPMFYNAGQPTDDLYHQWCSDPLLRTVSYSLSSALKKVFNLTMQLVEHFSAHELHKTSWHQHCGMHFWGRKEAVERAKRASLLSDGEWSSS